MAGGAFAFALEVRFSRLRISRHNILDLIGAAVRREFDLHVEKFRDAANLLLCQRRKGGHAFVRSAVLNHRPNQLPFVIIEHYGRTQQIGALSATTVCSMAKATGRREDLLAITGEFGIRLPAKSEKFP